MSQHLKSGFWSLGPKTMENQMKQNHLYGVPGLEEEDISVFLHGACGVFALALHEKFGYPIEALLDGTGEPLWDSLVHIYCPVEVHGRQGYADVRGITTNWDEFQAEFSDLCDIPNQHASVAPDELKRQLLMEMGSETMDQLYREAMELIQGKMCLAYEGASIVYD